MGKYIFRILILLSCAFVLNVQSFAQAVKDSTAVSKILVENADNARFVNDGVEFIRYLNGDVRFFQDSTFMYCDSAILRGNQLTAYGNVTIVQNDTINVFADSLVYDGNTKLAQLFKNVTLQSDKRKLYTDYLLYDLNTKIGSYTKGALLKSEKSEIKSLIGKYFVTEKHVKFYKKVTVVNEDFKLWSDSLFYDSELDIAYFIAPTRIDQDSSKIYCESGFYDMNNKLGEFRQNAQYTQEDKIALAELIQYEGELKVVTLAGNASYKELDKAAEADTIVYFEETEVSQLIGNASYKDQNRNIVGEFITYNGKTESFSSKGRATIVDSTTILTANSIEFIEESDLGVAYGNVIVVDTSSHTTIESGAMFYKKESNYSKAYNPDGTRPLLHTLLDGDSLFLRADTLLSNEIKDSINSTSYLYAYHNVKLFKSNLQAKCDSMIFNTTDSLITMYDSPVIWSDSSQFSADTIEVFLRNEAIYKIKLRQKGFIINTQDSVYFNQIKGKLIEVFFVDGAIDSMSVEGNAESIYFMLDEEDAYVGMNKSVCSKMSFTFEENGLKDIFFFINVNSNMIPIRDVDPNTQLDGFNWFDEKRPKNKNEL